MTRLLIYIAFTPILLFCANEKQLPLTNSMLASVDGIMITADDMDDTLWLMKEIERIHQGFIKVNSQKEPTVRNSTPMQAIYKNKKMTLKMLVETEGTIRQAPVKDQQEFDQIFQQVKLYFALVNETMLARARGAHILMKELIEDFCRKRNRPDSLLLNWEKGREVELYKTSIKSFKILYTVSVDLLLFLSDFFSSCPKAKALFYQRHGHLKDTK